MRPRPHAWNRSEGLVIEAHSDRMEPAMRFALGCELNYTVIAPTTLILNI